MSAPRSSTDGQLSKLAQYLSSFRPENPAEEETHRSCLELVRTFGPALFDSSSSVHVTASVLLTRGDQVLLHRHKLVDALLPPGGHLEVGETPLDAAQRELAEETGVPALLDTPEFVVALYAGLSGLGHTHLDVCFGGRVEDEVDPRGYRGGSEELLWMAAVDVESHPDVPASVRSGVRRLAQRRSVSMSERIRS